MVGEISSIIRGLLKVGMFLSLLGIVMGAALFVSCKSCIETEPLSQNGSQLVEQKGENMSDKVIKSEEEWRQVLTPEQYEITRKKGTESPFTGKYYDFKEKGIYRCVCCDNELFRSETKFDSGTGWPSFWAPISEQSIGTVMDVSYSMIRTEVLCSRCDAHLGHVFDDGPPPTGRRYCVNSVALKFAYAI